MSYSEWTWSHYHPQTEEQLSNHDPSCHTRQMGKYASSSWPSAFTDLPQTHICISQLVLLFISRLLMIWFWDRVSFYGPDWPGTHYLTMWFRLASNLWQTSFLSFWSTRDTGVNHYPQLDHFNYHFTINIKGQEFKERQIFKSFPRRCWEGLCVALAKTWVLGLSHKWRSIVVVGWRAERPLIHSTLLLGNQYLSTNKKEAKIRLSTRVQRASPIPPTCINLC